RGVSADIERVALIVIERPKVQDGEVREAPSDCAPGLCRLIRVRKMNSRAIGNSRRAQRDLPSIDEGVLDGERKEQIRFADYVVIKKIMGAGAEGVGVEDPSAIRNAYAELVFFIPLAVQRNES